MKAKLLVGEVEQFRQLLVDNVFCSLPTVSLEASAIGYSFWPEDLFWTVNYGVALELVGKFTEAEALLQHAYASGYRNRFIIETRLGKICAKTGRLAEAEEWFIRGTRSAPRSTAPWIYYGIFLANTQRFEAAIKIFRNAINAAGDVEEAHLNIGKCQRTLDDILSAKLSFEAALRICPEYDAAKIALKDVEEAIILRDRVFGEKKTIK